MAELQNPPPAPENPTPRHLVQPIISPGDLQQSPTQPQPLSLHSSSISHSEAEPRPAQDTVQQLPPLVAQRNIVQSLQVIPQPARFMFLDRSRSIQQLQNMNMNMRQQSGRLVMGQRQPSQNSLVAFRQDSLRGSRVLHIPSNQELPEVNRPLNAVNLTSNPASRALVIPIENIQEEENREEAGDGNRQGAQDEQALDVIDENEEHVPDPHERRISQVARLRVCLQLIFNITLLLIYGFAYLFIEKKIGVTAIFIIALCFVVIYQIGLFIKKKYSSRAFDRADYLIAVGNGASLIIYITMAYIKYKGTDIPLTPFSLFGILVVFGACCKSSLEPPQPSTVLILIVKVIAWVQLFLVALRIDSLGVPWSTIFIPLYFGLLLLAFSSILIIFGSTYAFINIMRAEGVSAKLILGSIWYILNALYTGAWLAILTQIVRHLDGNEGSIQVGLAIGLIHGGVLLLYTLGLWRILCKFQEFEVQSEMLVETTAENLVDQQNSAPQQRPQVRFQVSKDDKTHLVMISPTFYMYLKKHLKHKNEKDIQKLKTELERTKMERNINGLALRAPIRTDIPMSYAAAPSTGSPPRRLGSKPRDFSEGALHLRQQQQIQLQPITIPIQAAVQTPVQPPVMKRGESTRSGENLCTICYDSIPNAVFMDCGHGGVCYECAVENWKKSDYCILCRQKISKILKVVTIKPLNVTKVVECTRKIVENVQ